MSSRQKRSNGGYGLRRKIAKKRLDEDFEYYFSKIGAHFEPPTSKSGKEQKENKLHARLVMVTGLLSSNTKSDMKINDTFEKRTRGRPKKIEPEPEFTESALRLVDMKEKRLKKLNCDEYLGETETTKAVDEICPKGESIMAVACEEEVENVECIVKRIKLDTVLAGEEMTDLQEEEVVSCLPEGEKENLSEDGIHLEPNCDSEEVMGVEMNVHIHDDIEARTIYEEADIIDKDSALLKIKRKYKKGRLSQDAIQKLNQLSPDDKIECSECHKLLKPSSFRQHLRTHTGEKPFGCEVCDARFTRKGDVERHVRIVHNKQKPFKCCRCQRAFGDRKNLRWHLMNHDKKLFYVCEVCGFKFGKREYWENHVRFIHPIPGGLDLDENNIERTTEEEEEEEESEDRLRTLTKKLFSEDESSGDPTQDSVTSGIVRSIQMKENATIPKMTSSFINHISKQEGVKLINVKNLGISNLLKIGRCKLTGNIQPYTQVIGQNQGGGIEAVVIQFDRTTASGDNSLQSAEQIESKAKEQENLIHVVNSQDMLQIVDTGGEPHNPIVIETQDFEEASLDPESTSVIDYSSDVIQEQALKVEERLGHEGEENNGTIPYASEEDEEPSKVISIMLTEDAETEADTNSSSVQTLIEALLVAAKDSQSSDTQST